MNVQPLNLSPSCPVLIGRTSQRATLQAMIERASNGQGQCALIHGEAGIGKSRLVAEVRQAAHGRGCRLLQGYCFPADSAHPYAPLFDLLRAFLIAPPLNSSATDDVSVLRELAHFLPDLAILLPDLAPSSLQQRSTPEQRKRRLFALMTHFLIEQSSGQPLVMIVEDLHWCDENTLELLLDCVRTCQQQPILFLFTYRNEEILPPLRHWLAQLDRTRLAVDLALFPLAQSEVAAMVQAICAAPQPPDPDLLAAVDRLAEGNPFFVEEVLTALLANGGLLDQDGNWQRQSESSALSSLALVPRTVQDRVQQRVERLSAVARRLLTIAACAGRGFDVPLLLQVLHANEEELLPLLKELLTAHLILEESADHFAFRHALVQQAIYNGLLLRERRALHLLIAQAIESRQAVSALPDSYMEALSHHFSLAGDWAKTVVYALRAGERSITLYAPSAAIEQFTRALAAANALPTTPPSKAYLARGQAYQTRGDFARAKIDYEHALASAQQTSDGVLEWQSVMALGALWAGRDYSQAGEWFQRA
ncbi:MAG: AAA family ATPase, partial [Caldilineaceae bacterium]|nr:AAA family ATPase [Caldilineaceae bacterium]